MHHNTLAMLTLSVLSFGSLGAIDPIHQDLVRGAKSSWSEPRIGTTSWCEPCGIANRNSVFLSPKGSDVRKGIPTSGAPLLIAPSEQSISALHVGPKGGDTRKGL
jgi:hypothetical protein